MADFEESSVGQGSPSCSPRCRGSGRPMAREVGERFEHGFREYRDSAEFADCTVVIGSTGQETQLHSLLLAHHSDFFRKAFSSEFVETRNHRMQLHIQDHLLPAWAWLCEYFYKDSVELTSDNVFGLLALSRQLLVGKLENYCRSYIADQLTQTNCLANLFEAVRYDVDTVEQECVALVAAGFHYTYAQSTAGLPPHVILSILQHPALDVQCEAQVLEFVLSYVRSTELDSDTTRTIFKEVRWLYLSNERLTEMQGEDCVPRDMLLAGALCRLSVLDQPERSAELNVSPRPSYCSMVLYGLPGGCEYVDMPCHLIWDLLQPKLSVRVSGVSEGRVRNILLPDSNAWFCTNDSQHPPPWIEVHMPANVQILTLNQYSFSHGHSRPSYWRMCWWKSQAGTASCKLPGAAFTDLDTKPHQVGNDFWVANLRPGFALTDWRVLRLVGSGMQQDGVYRLCVKNLKLYGTVRLDLMRQAEGVAINKHAVDAALAGASQPLPSPTKLPVMRSGSPGKKQPPAPRSLYSNE